MSRQPDSTPKHAELSFRERVACARALQAQQPTLPAQRIVLPVQIEVHIVFDTNFLRKLRGLATEQARWECAPNPLVFCVLTSSNGTVLGQGRTQQVGGPHAEIMALRDAAAKGHSVVGATAYVTLEPCSHHGRTGPCCDALIAAGIKKVVATNLDPNPLVAGQGFARLRAAGVEVEVLDPSDPLAIASRELNIGFFSRMIRKTPWVRMKVAASLDGTTALDNGASQWITSPEARADGHAWYIR